MDESTTPAMERPADVQMPDPEQSRIGIVDDEADPTELHDALIDAAEQLLEIDETEAEGVTGRRPRRTHRARALALALTQKGVREEGGRNSNPFSRYFGFGPQEWCADFVSWAFDRSGNKDRKVPWGYPSAVVNITKWAQKDGHIVEAPKRGDIFTYKNGGHTGMVAHVKGDRFITIEGNTDGPDGTTTWCWTHRRVNDGSYHFVRFPD